MWRNTAFTEAHIMNSKLWNFSLVLLWHHGVLIKVDGSHLPCSVYEQLFQEEPFLFWRNTVFTDAHIINSKLWNFSLVLLWHHNVLIKIDGSHPLALFMNSFLRRTILIMQRNTAFTEAHIMNSKLWNFSLVFLWHHGVLIKVEGSHLSWFV
jgi:hypothetical protein